MSVSLDGQRVHSGFAVWARRSGFLKGHYQFLGALEAPGDLIFGDDVELHRTRIPSPTRIVCRPAVAVVDSLRIEGEALTTDRPVAINDSCHRCELELLICLEFEHEWPTRNAHCRRLAAPGSDKVGI